MAKGMVRLDRINGAQIYSLVHTAALENGMVCNLGSLAEGERELFEVATPTTDTLGSAQVVLIATPEVNYDSQLGIEDFYTPAGSAARGIGLVAGNIVTITDNMISGTTKVGEYVIAANNSLKLAASQTAGEGLFVGEVIEKTTLGYYNEPATVILVRKN